MQHFDKTRITDVFRNRSVRWYWTNTVVSAFGDSLTSVALLLLVLRETGSLSMMAGMSIVIAISGIVFGVLSAVRVDRWDAKRVVVLSQCVRAILILGLVYVDLRSSHRVRVRSGVLSIAGRNVRRSRPSPY